MTTHPSTQSEERPAGPETTRRALLEAARRRFGEDGYAGTSLNAIVAAAGVTKGAFYHHFEGKREIFERVYEAVKGELALAAFAVHADYDAFAAGAAERPRRGPLKMPMPESPEALWRDLERRCWRYVELHADERVQRIVLLDARAVLGWDSWRRVEREHGVVLLRADLRRAMRRGIVRPLPLHALATILAGALHEACVLVAHAEEGGAPRGEAYRVVRAMLEGLRAPPDAAASEAEAEP